MPPASEGQGKSEAERVREHLNRVLESPRFQGSVRQTAFLRFVVEKVLAGQARQITRSGIAVHVYGRGMYHNARAEAVIPSQAARLRRMLQEYYAGEGQADEFRIDLPKGSLVPEIITAEQLRLVVESTPATKASKRFRRRLVLAAAVVAAGGALVWVLGMRHAGSPLTLPDTTLPTSITVMPIRAEGSDGGASQLGEALTAALVSEMSGNGLPPWRQRTTVARGDASRTPSKAGAVLRGSIVMDNAVVRVVCSLERMPSQTALWNGVVERRLADWPEAQRGAMLENIAYTVASSLNAALTERMEGELAAVYKPRAEARRNWREGDEAWRRGDAESVRRAIGLMEGAADLDPNFAWNHASLAHAYVRALELGIVLDTKYRQRAHEEAARALELAPYLPLAHAAQARVLLALDWNLPGATAACVDALNTLSASYDVRRQCAQVYSLDGRADTAAALDERSVNRYEQRAIPLTDLALVRYRARQFEAARALAGKALEADNTYMPARTVLALAEMSLGRIQETLTMLDGAPADRTGRIGAITATAMALMGDVQGAQVALDKARALLHRPDQTDLIRPYLALRQGTRAATLIDEALARRNPHLLDLLADPQIANLDREGLFEPVRAKLRK